MYVTARSTRRSVVVSVDPFGGVERGGPRVSGGSTRRFGAVGWPARCGVRVGGGGGQRERATDGVLVSHARPRPGVSAGEEQADVPGHPPPI